MAQLNLSLPSFQGLDLSDEKQLRKLTSYLYKLDEQLRYVLNNLGEENLSDSLRAIINAQTDATVLDEMTGQVQRLSTQIVQTAQAISLKADKETLDALGETLGSSIAALEVTAEQIRTEVSDTASGLQSQINQQAGQITLSVQTANSAANTANSAAGAAANAQATANNKLDADAPSKGVNTGSGILINQNGVYVEGKEIDLRTSDGDEYVHISEAGVSASSITAPNVMPRYDGPSDLYIDPNWAESYLENGMYEPGDCLRSLKDALALLSNKSLSYAVNVHLRANIVEYGSAELIGCIAPYGVKIRAENTDAYPTIYGSIIVKGCLGTVHVWNMRVNPPSGSNGIHAIGYGVLVKPDYVIIRGAGTSARGYCMCADEGAKIIANGCETYDNECSIVSKSGSMFISIDNKGNCNPYIESAAMRFYGTASSADAGSLWWYRYGSMVDVYQDENVTVDQGAASGSNISTTTATYLATSTGSYKGSGSKYRNDVAQGWYDSIGRIRGCMWFDNTSIRNAMRGRTVLSATIRLAMRSNVGRGTSVTVELSGTYSNSGASSAAVTKSYGVLGTANPGETVTFTLPTAAVTDLVNGTINGLMLYSSDTGAYKERDYSKNYAVFDGAADATPPQLTVIYQ
jgi:hypothetical protein